MCTRIMIAPLGGLRYVFARFRSGSSLVAILPLASIPFAFTASVLVSSWATSHALETVVLDLPSREPQSQWQEKVASFAARLERAFDLPASTAREFAPWILEASARQKLPPALLASLVYTESTFRKRVRSRSGAVGPAQVKPGFWHSFCGEVDLREPEANVHCGAQILAHFLDTCGEFSCALRLYNVGPRNYREPHYRRASDRYQAKVDRHRQWLQESG